MPFWELEGLGWREARHNGTLVGARGLELIPGVSRGICELTLPERGPFLRLVSSLNAEAWPVGSGARLSVCARTDAGWSPWRSLGTYGEASDLPRSEPADEVQGDLLALPRPADELKVRLEVEAGSLGGSPVIRRLALEGWDGPPAAEDAGRTPAWGQILEVPARSQKVEAEAVRDRVCAPTSVGMVLAYHGIERSTAQLAAAAHDRGADLYGNWSFNVAVAAELGLRATVRRLDGLADLEAEIQAGRPVVISHRFEGGELPGSPLPRTDGHLLVVCGFTDEGDIVVNDPAADPAAGEEVRGVYGRAAFARAWLEKTPGGIAFVLEPFA